ncbi:MAG: glycosyltransferase family 2 protein [Bacillota bacterium]
MALLEILLLVIILFTGYTLMVGFCGLFTPPSVPLPPPDKRFCIIIPAHNEELVIEHLLNNLRRLDYPERLYDVVVVADNCSDETAEVASQPGVTVLERRDPKRRGKGYAVRYALRELGFINEAAGNAAGDAVVVFDADNLVEPDFLSVMNGRLQAGEHLIQCYVDSKNPADTWISGACSIMFWLNNRFTLLARENLGLSAVFMGTGMCISRQALMEVGWDTHTLTEDLEYSVQAVLAGYRTRYTHDTCIYDEKPLTFAVSCRQRLRWARGQISVMFHYAPRLIAEGFRRPCIVRLEAGLRLAQILVLLAAPPTMYLYYGVLGAGGFAAAVVKNIPLLPLIMGYFPYVFVGLLFVLDEPPTRVLKYLPFYPLFTLSWLILLLLGLFTHRQRRWMHTQHTRGVELSGLEETGEDLAYPDAHLARVSVEEGSAAAAALLSMNEWL